jgi:hypothetical protein
MALEYSWPETQDREEQQILDMLTVDFAEQEDYQKAVAIDAVAFLLERGLLKEFYNSIGYAQEDYQEFLESYDDGYLKRTYGIGDQ